MSQSDFSSNVVFLMAVLGAVGGVWWRIEAAIAKAKGEALSQAISASTLATNAYNQLAEHKLHCAEVYITKAGLRETTAQILNAVNSVRDDVHGLNDRIDRIIENHQAPPQRPRRAG